MKKSKVTYFNLPFNGITRFEERENWFVKRHELFSFNSNLKGEKAAEQAFHITNCPVDMLEGKYKKLVKDFHGPSMSSGDIVRVDRFLRQPGDNYIPEYYLCLSIGWEKYDGDVIELNKYLL